METLCQNHVVFMRVELKTVLGDNTYTVIIWIYLAITLSNSMLVIVYWIYF